jgi:aerobic carbon-monoxide dehydrogenase large subunit
VAEDPYALADALEVVRIEDAPLPPVTCPEEAQRTTARLHEGWADNVALTVRGAVGDAERGLDGADLVIHETFHHPRLAAVPMETRGVLAYRDAETDTLVIWTSHQNPYRVRDAVATVLGRPAERVRVMIPDTGGGFGPKGQVHP